MKIKELSNITNINPETIRSYRNKGFLHPVRKANGYYEYSNADAITLFNLAKLRGYEMPVAEIEQFSKTWDPEKLIAMIDVQKQKILHEIEELQRKVRYMDFEIEHITECVNNEAGVSEMQSVDDKIDFYDFDDPDINFNSDFYYTSTPTLWISKDVLNGKITDEIIPIKAGLGSYRHIYEEKGITPPANSVLVPDGKCLSMMVRLHDLDHIELRKLKPIIEYAKEHDITFCSDTTGYLVHFELIDDKPTFYYRIRACFDPTNK